jgi:hypothetical protein
VMYELALIRHRLDMTEFEIDDRTHPLAHRNFQPTSY